MAIEIRALQEGDRPWANRVLQDHWGSTGVVSRGRRYELEAYPGWVAWLKADRVGVLHYRMHAGDCEILSLISLQVRQGIGSALLRKMVETAQRAGCERIWLVTTNDNLPALAFYQRCGFRLCGLYPGAVEAARQLKPSLPEKGYSGIPIRDELELEFAGYPEGGAQGSG